MLSFLSRIATTWTGIILLFSACADSAPKEEKLQGIVFKRISQSTRVEKTENVKDFRISAVWTINGSVYEKNFMNNIYVEKVGEDWEYSPSRYWPSFGEIDFFAYTPGNSSGVKDFAIDTTAPYAGKVTIEYDVTTDVQNQEDFLVATAYKQKHNTNSGDVALDFTHMLSFLEFEVKAPSNYIIKSLLLRNIDRAGTLTKDGENQPWVWTNNTSAADKKETYSVSMSGSIGNLVILPQKTTIGKSGSSLTEPADISNKFYFVITYEYSSQVKTLYVPLDDNGSEYEFKQNTKYQIVLDLVPFTRSVSSENININIRAIPL